MIRATVRLCSLTAGLLACAGAIATDVADSESAAPPGDTAYVADSGLTCGNAVCDPDETCAICAEDCGTCVSTGCPNGVCDSTETCVSCPEDCGLCAGGCGDALCDGAETCGNCEVDCGSCVPGVTPFARPIVPSGVMCLSGSGPLITLTGAQAVFDRRSALGDFTRIDAQEASWLGQGNTPVRIGNGTDICFSGGLIQGGYDDATTWSAMHDAYAMLVYGPNAIIEGVRVHDYGDGINWQELATGWTVRHSHYSYIRDDCVSNDSLHPGLIEDNLFDGCYVGYSARRCCGYSGDGSGNVVTIRNTLMRLQLMPTSYSGTGPGHGKFFKLDAAGVSPQMALFDNLFRVDELSGGSSMYFIPPPEKIASCSNNVIVWLGAGDFPEPLPSCYTLTRDKGVWDRAVAEWKRRHGEL